ncbi:flagellar hook-basal body complex protein FliE [Rhizobium sp. KVB221]|uniref:Flagellar hook-basal body complex protein FliE n=1 Tax=Rhizobium setariae TaxID=2801340 RepID=A0A936YM26_9HYPH|nr:flagellar hook-basal body complex protein FliE [Rhizobium setariae]MBL0370676.1 flagellar hook-basal body complex protein FliE [Rhizobium setariae]
MIDAINSLNAASLASEMRKAAETEGTNPAASAQVDDAGASFASFMSSMATTFSDNLKDAEKKSMDGMMGKAGVREVVESVMTADQTLQTAMAFRDKIVSAYLEVIKMPI